MHICLPTGIFPPDIGGPASYVPRIARALVERGHAVQVITLSEVPRDDSGYPFSVERIPRGMARLPRMARTIAAIARAARKADVVYANGLFIETVLARVFAPRPLVMKIVGDWAWERATLNHRIWDDPRGFQERRQPLREEAVKQLRGWASRLATHVIVPSHSMAEIVASWGVERKRLSVVYNSPDPAPAEDVNLPPFDGLTLAAIGRLIPLKRIDSLLHVMTNIPGTRLVVAGDGPSRAALEDEALRLGLRSRVLFLGAISPSRVAGVLRASDLFVLNSTFESLSHVVLEALAAGTPVLATCVGGVPEVIQHNVCGWLVAPDDEDELDRAVRHLVDDAPLRERLREGGRRVLETRFRWETLVEQTLAVLEGVRP